MPTLSPFLAAKYGFKPGVMALINPCDVNVGAQLRQRHRGVRGGVADRGRERRVLVRYISVTEMALSIMNISSTAASYEFRDVFVGLPDARRKYIDASGAIRRSNCEGGILYRAYLARSEETRQHTFLEWSEKYDARGRELKMNVIQKVHMPCVSKDWHVERIAWYYILMHVPHSTRPNTDDLYGFVGVAQALQVPLEGQYASGVEEFVNGLERWWLQMYEQWLTSIGQRAGGRTERTYEMATQALIYGGKRILPKCLKQSVVWKTMRISTARSLRCGSGAPVKERRAVMEDCLLAERTLKSLDFASTESAVLSRCRRRSQRF